MIVFLLGYIAAELTLIAGCLIYIVSKGNK